MVRIFIAGTAFCVVFAVRFSLYHLFIAAVIYPALLNIVLGSNIVVFDFLRVKREHEALSSIRSVTDVLAESLSKIDGINSENAVITRSGKNWYISAGGKCKRYERELALEAMSIEEHPEYLMEDFISKRNEIHAAILENEIPFYEEKKNSYTYSFVIRANHK